MLFFSIYDEKITKLSLKNRFRTAASPGACKLFWASWIDARRQYIILVIIIVVVIK